MTHDTFAADMKALYDAGYHSIKLQQYLDWEAGKNPVLPPKPILLTDDDGDASIDDTASGQPGMTSVLQSYGYTMVAFVVTGFVDNDPNNNLNWDQLRSMVASGTWEVAFHAGADGHYDYSGNNGPLPAGQKIEQNAPDFYADYFTANNGWRLETDAQYQARVNTELAQGIKELQQEIPTAYTNVFAVPWNDYGEYYPDTQGGQQQQDLTTIFDRFTVVFVEDNNYPNSVYGNHHQYRFEVHGDTSTNALLSGPERSCIHAFPPAEHPHRHPGRGHDPAPLQRRCEHSLRPHRHRRGQRGQRRHDLQRPGDAYAYYLGRRRRH